MVCRGARRSARFPLGASVTLEALAADLHGVTARLRASEPVSCLPALGGWVVTSYSLVVEAMRDAQAFTVDDPRFSTGRVLGPSMLSLDGEEHARHREPFALPLRAAAVRAELEAGVRVAADELVEKLARRGRRAELRAELAGPLAARVMTDLLSLDGVKTDELLGWYAEIVAEVTRLSSGGADGVRVAAVDGLADAVRRSIRGSSFLGAAAGALDEPELVANVGVMLFGGLETSEAATANAFAHLLRAPSAWARCTADRALLANAVDESLRLEPAAAQLDRYATRDLELGGVEIGAGDFVVLSLAAANRDPEVFAAPDVFDPVRANTRKHLAFAQGPHACLGVHLARLETLAALEAVRDRLPGIRLDPDAPAPVAEGVVFRKPPAVNVVW
ncbi:MAG: cytochrome P450 [Gaiella sp.]